MPPRKKRATLAKPATSPTIRIDRKKAAKKKNLGIKPKKARQEKPLDPAMNLFTELQRLLPKFGVPLDIPSVCQHGLVVQSKKAKRHDYAFIMESMDGTLSYRITFAKSHPPEPDYAVETAVAFAIEGRFCFSETLDSHECKAADAETVAGEIIQRFTAAIMAHLRAQHLIQDIESTITAWLGTTQRENPLTA